jgi:hypothetical protein
MMKRVIQGTMVLLAAALLGGGCDNSAGEQGSPATGRVTVSLVIQGAAPAASLSGGSARVLMPGLSPDPFSRYEVSFRSAGGAVSGPAVLSGGSGVVELASGTYTMTGTAYTGSGEGVAAAVGERVVVVSGGNETAALTLGPKSGGGNGSLGYDLTTPAGVSGTLTVTTPEGGAVSGGTADLAAGQASTGSLSLGPGAYRVRAVLGGATALEEELLIYTGLTSVLPARVFGGTDVPGDTSRNGSLGIGIGFGYGALAVTGNDGTNVIAPGGSLTLTASAEFSAVTWYVDGSSTGQSGGSLTLNAAEYTARPHTVSFTGVKDGRPYSTLIPFTVEGTGGSSKEPVSPAGLADYLAALPENTADTPHTVALDVSVDVNSAQWASPDLLIPTIKRTIIRAGRYVELDLSACTARGNTIGYYVATDLNPRYFDLMGKPEGLTENPYVVGIILPATLTGIGSRSFFSWIYLKSVVIPAGVTVIGEEAFAGCNRLTRVNIPAGVTDIANSTFSGCYELSEIAIPWGVTRIGSNAFNMCTSLRGIILPPGITSIGEGAFSGTGIERITLPEGVTLINGSAFKQCTALEAVSLPATLETIEGAAFQECTALSSITIPPGVRTIGFEAFQNCGKLTRITFEGYSTRIDVKYSDRPSFPSDFSAVYNAQYVKAGKYEYEGGEWRKKK